MKSLKYLIIPLLLIGTFPVLHAQSESPHPDTSTTAGAGSYGVHPDAVVVTPFGTTTRRALNAAIGSLKGEGQSQMPLSSLFNTMLGKVPGLYV